MSTVARVAFGQRTTVSTFSPILGPGFHLGANTWGIKFIAPDSLCTIEGSNDKLNWNVMVDAFGNEITNLGDVIRVGVNRPRWLRFDVAADISQPRDYTAAGIVQKETG
jgi:hypothetical protein